MAERKQNWYTRFVKWFGPSFFIETGNPRMDDGGGAAFTMFGSTKKGSKFSLGMKESGVVQLNADSTLEIVAGQDNNDGGQDILINSRNGAIDIKVSKNGDVRISGSNVSISADAAIDMKARVIRLQGKDEISLQAPYIHSRGKKGNLVPKTWGQVATFGTYIGVDKFDSFIEKGLQQAAGIVNEIDDLAPEFESLAGKAGDLAKGLGDSLPGMADQLSGLTGQLSGATGQLSGLTGNLSSLAETAAPQLQSIAGDLAPQLQSIATSPEVTQLGAALKENAGAFANLGKGLEQVIPSGY